MDVVVGYVCRLSTVPTFHIAVFPVDFHFSSNITFPVISIEARQLQAKKHFEDLWAFTVSLGSSIQLIGQPTKSSPAAPIFIS
jgi:hypothetical protein